MSASYYMQGFSEEYHIHHGVDLLNCDTGNKLLFYKSSAKTFKIIINQAAM